MFVSFPYVSLPLAKLGVQESYRSADLAFSNLLVLLLFFLLRIMVELISTRFLVDTGSSTVFPRTSQNMHYTRKCLRHIIFNLSMSSFTPLFNIWYDSLYPPSWVVLCFNFPVIFLVFFFVPSFWFLGVLTGLLLWCSASKFAIFLQQTLRLVIPW